MAIVWISAEAPITPIIPLLPDRTDRAEPRPARTSVGGMLVRSMTVVGVVPQKPPSRNQFHQIVEPVLDFPALGQRRFVAGQLQRRGQQRFAEFFEQRQRNTVIGNCAGPIVLRFGVQHPPR